MKSLNRPIYWFTGVFSAVLYTVLLVAPVIALPLIEKYGLDAGQIGLLFSFELGAFSLATIPAYLWLTRVPLTVSVTICTLIVVAGNIVSGFVPTFETLLLTRTITSLAAGSITVVILALGPKTSNPGRAFGIFTVAQLAMGALILFAFPVVFANADVSWMYWTLAALAVLCLPFIPMLRGISLRQESGAPVQRLARRNVLPFVGGMIAIALFYVGLSGVWTFMAQISVASGNEEGATSTVLAVATMAGVASALLATILGESPHRRLYLIISYVLMAGAVLVLLGGPGLIQFGISAILFKFGWTMILPYLLSGVSSLGGGPQTMNTVNLMIGAGFVVGPLLAGQLAGNNDGFTSMIWVAFGCLIVSMICMLVLTRRDARAAESSTSESPAVPVAPKTQVA